MTPTGKSIPRSDVSRNVDYHPSTRFQIAKVVAENGADRYINGPALPKRGQAIAEAKSRFNQFGGLWLVYDTKPRKRSGGYEESNIVVFDTLAMHREAIQYLIDRGNHD